MADPYTNKMIILYGDERFIKEIEYVCSGKILPVIHESILREEKKRLGELNGLVVLCAYDMESAEQDLRERGLKYGEEYIFARDFLRAMDRDALLPKNSSRKIVFWGCGKIGERIGRNDGVDFYIDSNAALSGSTFLGKRVVCPSKIINWKDIYIYIVTSDKNRIEIEAYLQSKGLVPGEDYYDGNAPQFLLNTFSVGSYSDALLQTIHDRPIKDLHCDYGMRKVDFSEDGHMYPCCDDYVYNFSVGYLLHGDVKTEWDSYGARIFKLSLVNHTFSFCNPSGCNFLYAHIGGKERYDITYAGGEYEKRGGLYPSLPTISIDRSCNLKCESCRNDYFKATEQQLRQRELLADKIAKEVLPNAEWIFLAGQGDIFYSPIYRKMWINETGIKRKGIQILTNGLLFNQRNWELLEAGYENIRLGVSIDAASPKVYEKVRRGGIWEVLCRNMEFAGRLRKAGKIERFWITFVVQQKNYLDMKHFIELGKTWNCDYVSFARIRNLGTYSEQEFDESITLFDNHGMGQLKDKYREFFNDPIFDEEIVSKDSISAFKR